MQQVRVVRRAAGMAAAALVATGMVVAPASAGHAATQPVRRQDTSGHNLVQLVKEATAECPDGQRAFAAGARVNDSHVGRVLLTRMEPNQALTSVTVEARARLTQTEPWSVTAFVVCRFTSRAPELERGEGVPGAVATCDGDATVTGTGFRIEPTAFASYVTGVVPAADLSGVEVTTGGAEPAAVASYAICHDFTEPEDPFQDRLEAAQALDGDWPAMVTVSSGGPSMYGVGGSVTGIDGVHLDAFVPNPDAGAAGVRAVLDLPPGQAAGAAYGTARSTAGLDGLAELDADGGEAEVDAIVREVFH